ncbi:hypothetical protein RDABS01_008818 [Bienertia sinuspersici]
MGLILGKITVETPKHEILASTNDYEIRKYPPSVIAEVTYNPSEMKDNKDGGFPILANYIGALGKPQNTKSEPVAMTAPVITQTQKPENPSSETIAMTAPVITKQDSNDSGIVTMQFILPAKYSKAEDAPKPLDERVVIKEEGEKKFGVVKFSGFVNDGIVKEKVERLKNELEKDGYKVIGDYLLARYNPPWTIPFLRTNEVFLPVE